MKRRKGITLISLVVTIIVLIILASFAISLALSKSGIAYQALKVQEEQATTSLVDKFKVYEAQNTLRNEINKAKNKDGVDQEETEEEFYEQNRESIGKISEKGVEYYTYNGNKTKIRVNNLKEDIKKFIKEIE